MALGLVCAANGRHGRTGITGFEKEPSSIANIKKIRVVKNRGGQSCPIDEMGQVYHPLVPVVATVVRYTQQQRSRTFRRNGGFCHGPGSRCAEESATVEEGWMGQIGH